MAGVVGHFYAESALSQLEPSCVATLDPQKSSLSFPALPSILPSTTLSAALPAQAADEDTCTYKIA